MANGVVDR